MKVDEFLCGVIEGYYGRPWSFDQRKILFQKFGLNTYMYAPKDDDKHRSRWRDLYNEQQANQLKELIDLTKQNGIKFIYALSPGLDIRYSDENHFNALKNKFDQLSNLGCENWSLLFDDIENEMCEEDQKHYSSFADAQVSITNQLFNYLNQPKIFLFCPTEYCSRMALPRIDQSDYLNRIGNGLHSDIGILWTGPKVVSRRIRLNHLLEVNKVLKRRVTIWENLNANDYDQRRLCLGPLTGRSTNISSQINGMLTNPNCEFELNYIPFHTLGQWFQSLQNNSMENSYEIDRALDGAIEDWLPEFNLIKSCEGMSSKSDELMECDANGELTMDHIRLLVELFYLPYENGRNVQQNYSNFYWLRFHSNQLPEWHQRANIFHQFAKNVSNLLTKLLSIHNRALLYDVYFYILDMNSTIDLCSKYLHWIEKGEKQSMGFMSGDVEPWCTRGGLAGSFLNILPLGDFQSIIQSDFNCSMYFIRPIHSNDRSSMYSLINGDDQSQIMGDKLIGGYLMNLCEKYEMCYGIDDNEDRLCGFVLTIEQSENYDQHFQGKWFEELQRKYPNIDQKDLQLNEYPQWIYKEYSSRIQFFIDFTLKTDQIFHLGMKLMKILTQQLEKKGCRGCHAIIDERDPLVHQFYLRLGFIDIPLIDENTDEILLGKQF